MGRGESKRSCIQTKANIFRPRDTSTEGNISFYRRSSDSVLTPGKSLVEVRGKTDHSCVKDSTYSRRPGQTPSHPIKTRT